MARTLTRRKVCVKPHGTIVVDQSAHSSSLSLGTLGGYGERTVPVVMQVEELIAPLGHDSEGVFKESDND